MKTIARAYWYDKCLYVHRAHRHTHTHTESYTYYNMWIHTYCIYGAYFCYFCSWIMDNRYISECNEKRTNWIFRGVINMNYTSVADVRVDRGAWASIKRTSSFLSGGVHITTVHMYQAPLYTIWNKAYVCMYAGLYICVYRRAWDKDRSRRDCRINQDREIIWEARAAWERKGE